MQMTLTGLLASVEAIARQAGDAVMAVYGTDFAVRAKDDASPVTAADERAEALILAGLRKLTPDTPVVAEEAVAAGQIPTVSQRFWLVDPLDGTREFICRNGEFTVNIALVEDGAPRLGVVLAPALGHLYSGVVGAGAWIEEEGGRRPIRCRTAPPEGLTVVASASHANGAALDAFLANTPVAACLRLGSSIKLCLVASGQADLYPRLGRTMEWDIAAGHAILRAAGGDVSGLDGSPLRYGKAGFANPHFVARGLRRP